MLHRLHAHWHDAQLVAEFLEQAEDHDRIKTPLLGALIGTMVGQVVPDHVPVDEVLQILERLSPFLENLLGVDPRSALPLPPRDGTVEQPVLTEARSVLTHIEVFDDALGMSGTSLRTLNGLPDLPILLIGVDDKLTNGHENHSLCSASLEQRLLINHNLI